MTEPSTRANLLVSGGWMPTSTGKLFPVLAPQSQDIDILDIARGLGKQCRYSGQADPHYSVAEHSYYISYCVNPEYALWGLLHDASEAYIADLPRPLKRNLPEYKIFETPLMQAIANRFSLTWPEPAQVKEFDTRILINEFDQLFPEPARSAGIDHFIRLGYERIPNLRLACWQPQEATERFLQRYYQLVKDW